MEQGLAVDMLGTFVNVEHMSKMIQIRNVPDELHRTLKLRALEEGMTLSDFIKRELAEVAVQASLEEIDARVRARGPSGLRTETIREALDELRAD